MDGNSTIVEEFRSIAAKLQAEFDRSRKSPVLQSAV